MRFVKGGEGGHAVECTRADGRVVRYDLPSGDGLPRALLRFVVEDTLRLRGGWFDLLARAEAVPDAGPPWDADDFAEARPEALGLAEVITACFAEEIRDDFSESEGFEDALREACAEQGVALADRVTADGLRMVRMRLVTFDRQWSDLEPGEAVQVAFQVPSRR